MCGRIKEKAVKQDIRRKSLLLPEENKKPYGREKQSMEKMTEIYEKARYSDENIDEKDVLRMKELSDNV